MEDIEVSFEAGSTEATADSIVFVAIKRTDADGVTRRSSAVLVGSEVNALASFLASRKAPRQPFAVAY